MKEQQVRRPHVYELDLLRTVTAFSVIAVHVLSFTVVLNATSAGVEIQNAVVTALHFTREVFMFVTAFAMVYVYYGKPFALKRFWTKRSVGVLLPYCLWSVVYVLVNTPGQSLATFIKTAAVDILTGNASYQLYYILLTLQFYIILPLFLLFMKRVARHPWKVLSISFVIEVVLLYADYHLLQQGPLASNDFWQGFADFQNRFLLIYQFYFILGGFTALYFQQIRSFLLRYGWMTNLLAARMAGRIAAFASVSGSYYPVAGGYHPARPVPLLEIHGTGDTVVPYDGSRVKDYSSVTSWLLNWVKQDHYSSHPDMFLRQKTMLGEQWVGCKAGATIIHYRILREGHTWPRVLFRERRQKKMCYVNATTLVWQFFQSHPMIGSQRQL